MPLTPAEQAGHALRVRIPSVAQAAVSALYRLRPDLEQRYGEAGRRHCAKDLGHHLRFLAASVELDDPKVFVDYAAWAAKVMVTHNVAAEDAVASFRGLLDVAPGAVPPEFADRVRDVITAALQRLETEPPASGACPRPRPRGASSAASSPAAPPPGVSPSTGGSAPSRS